MNRMVLKIRPPKPRKYPYQLSYIYLIETLEKIGI